MVEYFPRLKRLERDGKRKEGAKSKAREKCVFKLLMLVSPHLSHFFVYSPTRLTLNVPNLNCRDTPGPSAVMAMLSAPATEGSGTR